MLFPKKPTSDFVTVDNVVAGVATSSMLYHVSDEGAINKIIRTLNNEENRGFFNMVFRESIDVAKQRLLSFSPELSAYWRAMSAYPPYQVMLSMPQQSQQLSKYENLIMVFKLQCMMQYFSPDVRREILILPWAVQAIEMYHNIYFQDKIRAFSCIYFSREPC